MARISRKQNRTNSEDRKADILQTAFYLRLSDSDELQETSESIANQESLLMNYIKERPEFWLVSTFVDDGKTGTNFKRPGFEAMMEAVKNKKINCIMVKDLSRFGRNFLETGNYIENVFPFLNVRFIAVTDGFDSLTSSASDMAFLMPLKNMMNENYARDISIKERSAKKVLRKKGHFLGPHAIYGYLKSEQDKHQLCIDPEAATVVRRIFDMGEQGFSDSAVAKYLNEHKIWSPAKYKYEKGILHHEKYAKSVGWYPQTVAMILNSRTYIGDMVQGGYCSSEMKGKRKVIPEEQRDIVPNRHEAIISKEQFERVAQMRRTRHQQYNSTQGSVVSKTENLFGGKIVCADCKKVLERKYVKSCSDKYRYICSVHDKNNTCSRKYVLESDLKNAVFSMIRNRIELVSDINHWLLKKRRHQWKKIEGMNQVIIDSRQELLKFKEMLSRLYIDLQSGLFNKSEYQFVKENHQRKIAVMEERLKQLEKERTEYIEEYTPDNPAVRLTLSSAEQDYFSRKTIELLLDRVEVYEHNRIKVYLNFEDEIKKILSFISSSEKKEEDYFS